MGARAWPRQALCVGISKVNFRQVRHCFGDLFPEKRENGSTKGADMSPRNVFRGCGLPRMRETGSLGDCQTQIIRTRTLYSAGEGQCVQSCVKQI